ncbi:hypothetical protein Taro_013599, partial [Colocasia esculenta]|nr:hypothetical protein [Colocasia esculenta]
MHTAAHAPYAHGGLPAKSTHSRRRTYSPLQLNPHPVRAPPATMFSVVAIGLKLPPSPLQSRLFLAQPPAPDAAAVAVTLAVPLSRSLARVKPVLFANRPPTTSAWSVEGSAVVPLEEAEGAGSPSLPPVRIVAVVGEGVASPLKGASWEEVMRHTVSWSLSSSPSLFLLVNKSRSRKLYGNAANVHWAPRGARLHRLGRVEGARWRGALLLRGSSSATASAASHGRGGRLPPFLPFAASPPPSSHPPPPYKYPMRGEGEKPSQCDLLCVRRYYLRCGTSSVLYPVSTDGDLTLVDVNSSVLAADYRQALDLVDIATSGTSVPSSDTQAVASGTVDSEFQVVPSLPGIDTSDSLSVYTLSPLTVSNPWSPPVSEQALWEPWPVVWELHVPVVPLPAPPLTITLRTTEGDLAIRLKWVDEGYQMLVYTNKSLFSDDPGLDNLRRDNFHVDILLTVAIDDKEVIDWVEINSGSVPNVISFESSPAIRSKLGGSFVQTNVKGNLFHTLVSTVKGDNQKESSEVVRTLSDAWERHNSDDIRFCLLVIINAYIRPVPILKNLRSKGFFTLNCMVKNCGSEVLNCLLDPNCRKALQCLNSCAPTDQVCNYRCIASYESPHLEAFSLCVLQKHNCLALDAEIPNKPYVLPMATFRGEALSHETAEDLFVGWLGKLEWSWRVVSGQNPAYDQFPCQYQLFYRGKAKGSFWYEPVFQVRTLEGQMVWRRRKYRVRRATDPGTFYFSVLDNGVVSKEYWTIVDVCDDLSWGLFHYKGAAQAAGQSYTGAVLVSPDGNYPTDMGGQRLASALAKCCIKEWELYTVDNDSCLCANAPLGIPEGSGLHCKIDIREERWLSIKKKRLVKLVQISNLSASCVGS